MIVNSVRAGALQGFAGPLRFCRRSGLIANGALGIGAAYGSAVTGAARCLPAMFSSPMKVSFA